MGKRILIALDESENAFRAVQFIADYFTSDHQVTLFSVIPDVPSICQMDSPSLTPVFKAQQTALCTLEDKKRELVKEGLEKARERLAQAGFGEENIRVKLETVTKRGVASNIIMEANSGYDIVVLGRRGLSEVREFFLGSVSQKVLHAIKDVSVVLVD